MPYIVGERRPELFIPNTNGYISPSVPRGGGGMGSLTVIVNVYGSVQTEQDLHRYIYNGLRELERSGLRLGAA